MQQPEPPGELARMDESGMSVSSADIPAAPGIGDGDAAEVPLRESGAIDPLRRFQEAFGPFFTGVDPVAFQQDLRDGGPTIPIYPAGG